MNLFMAFGITFLLLVLSVYKGIFLGYALLAALAMFTLIAIKMGYKPKDIFTIIINGGKNSLIVIQIFVLIGAVIAMWMASGTVPAIVYYGLKFLRPDAFILSAFLISCFVSFLIGTSVGTSGTVGIAMMLIAKSGGVNISVVAGAIIAGAYFGDRCSPMSSSANLVAFVTDTNIYENVKNMLKTSVVPIILSIFFYIIVSRIFPLNSSGNAISGEIAKSFNVGIIVLLPGAIIIAFSLFRINVKYSIICSLIAAAFLGIFLQQESIKDCIRYFFFGYTMNNNGPLYSIVKGGGVISMLNTCFVLFIASSLAGLIEKTEMLKGVEAITEKADSRFKIYRNVLITSIFTAAIGCCQAFTILLTDVLNAKAYQRNSLDKYSRAIDLENTSVLISALIPWNLSLLLPMTVLGTDFSCIPFLFYIYILPLWNLLFLYTSRMVYNSIAVKSLTGLFRRGLRWGAKY